MVTEDIISFVTYNKYKDKAFLLICIKNSIAFVPISHKNELFVVKICVANGYILKFLFHVELYICSFTKFCLVFIIKLIVEL
ncbi:Protein of unknown function [Gryllus bimaculatus]|nr:Protein of unknown function [Gryllus bimaculatus]